MRRVIRIIEYVDFQPDTSDWLEHILAASPLPIRSDVGRYLVREVAIIEIPNEIPDAFLAKPIPNFPIDVPAVIDDREPVTVPDDAYWVEDLT